MARTKEERPDLEWFEREADGVVVGAHPGSYEHEYMSRKGSEFKRTRRPKATSTSSSTDSGTES